MPKSLNEAFGLAKIQEEYLMSSKKSFKNGIDNGKPSILGLPKLEGRTNNKMKLPLQRLTSTQIEERRKLGLCYNCDEKWQMGHKCKGAKLFLLEGWDVGVEHKLGVQLVELEDDGVVLEHQATEKQEDMTLPAEITLYALVGSPASQTMMVKGRILNQEVVYLIDSGSTNNFLDATELPTLQLHFDTSQVLEVKVADESIVQTLGVCHGVTIFMQRYNFVVDFNVLHLGGCAVVLGTQWLSTLGEISWDFKLLTMKFSYLGKRVLLQGLNPSESILLDADKLFDGSVKKGLVLYIDVVTTSGLDQPSLPAALLDLLKQFSQVDGSWRMCIDYRALNKATIKDKFPIPVVDELLDELADATIFSKLDLRSGYHQICMKLEDIPKTTFRTHEGHYEFLVMPFGLTNAPSTFQALMNAIFKPYLRKFVLLYAKMSKCVFGCAEVEYLGHIISGDRVKVDPKKTIAMQQWPVPTTVKALKGFLGLIGYFRKLLEGAVLMPDNRPIAFHSQVLKRKYLHLSTYETELLALASVVKKCRPYLLGRPFVVKIDHQSLKFLLEQRIATPA
ncbi:uncharacterized protein LOC142635031 [Castanea sativa]|uniref:uncharacterized protein LOC142635031 n=1 Tax=Castanea sativa TaxID=21020 RepID=UPI003F64CF9F